MVAITDCQNVPNQPDVGVTHKECKGYTPFNFLITIRLLPAVLVIVSRDTLDGRPWISVEARKFGH